MPEQGMAARQRRQEFVGKTEEGDSGGIAPGLQAVLAAVFHKVPKGQTPRAAHWALAILEQDANLASILGPGRALAELRRGLREAVAAENAGAELTAQGAVARAVLHARQHGRATPELDDLAWAIAPFCEELLAKASGSQPSAPLPERKAATPPPRPTNRRPTLEQHTLNLTALARNGQLGPIVGREKELDLLIETLCRVTKRNPALVGPAGVGKTAIVEGLAQRIVSGDVPDLLRNVTLYSLQPPLLIAGADSLQEYIARVRDIIKEASAPDVVLFVDEAHSLMGQAQDLVTLLKPALARGQIACIAATTDHEFRMYIERDTALERRFQPIRVGEMGRSETLAVLRKHRDRLEAVRNVEVSDSALERVVALAAETMPNRQFPDKAVDVLEQAVAHAVAARRKRVQNGDIDTVVQRLTGVPSDIRARLEALEQTIRSQGLLADADTRELMGQLRVATSGLDRHPERPNAVVLLQAEAAGLAMALCETIAAELAGSPERVVTYELSNMTHPADVSRLIGSPPGYVGHGDTLPIHALIQYPRSVLLFQDVDLCNPSVASTIASALGSGALTDGTGRQIQLCDCVAVLTANRGREARAEGSIGLRATSRRTTRAGRAAPGVPADIERLCTLVVSQPGSPTNASPHAVDYSEMLKTIERRYALRGISIEWGEGMSDWFRRIGNQRPDLSHSEEEIYLKIGEAILAKHAPDEGIQVRITPEGDLLQVEILSRGTRRGRKAK